MSAAEEILNYEALVKKAADNKENKKISNSSTDHALVGVRYLINNATSGKIRIISSEFYASFWEEMKVLLTEYVTDTKGTIEIILLKSGLNEVSRDLLKNGGVKVYKIDNKNIDTENIPHFIVIDPVGYRIELSDKEKENQIVKGFVNFGDAEGTKRLTDFFDGLKPLCLEVSTG